MSDARSLHIVHFDANVSKSDNNKVNYQGLKISKLFVQVEPH